MRRSGLASKKQQSRSPFDESQTEYVKIPSAVKRPCVLTDRQKEVLARQKAGELQQPLAACRQQYYIPKAMMHGADSITTPSSITTYKLPA